MNRIVVLDSGPLGYVTFPRTNAVHTSCVQWLDGLLAHNISIYIPEIADYETRRGFLRVDAHRAIAKLDALKASLEYLHIMLRAAALWAETRKQGRRTADDKALDGDVILAAQTLTLGPEAMIATTNVKHLGRLAPAQLWHDIMP